MESVPEFIRAGYLGQDLGDILLKLGHESRSGPASERWKNEQGPKKQCFRNATELALRYPDELIYVEGYAFADIEIQLPLAHAWTETEEGEVVDPTWQGGSGYFGIAFPPEELREYLLLSEQYGVLQSLWIEHKMRERFFENRGLHKVSAF